MSECLLRRTCEARGLTAVCRLCRRHRHGGVHLRVDLVDRLRAEVVHRAHLHCGEDDAGEGVERWRRQLEESGQYER